MARQATAPELANFRTDNQHSRLYLGIMNPTTVLSARVDGNPASDDELATLTIDGSAFGGGYSSAPIDLLVYVGSSAGAYDKGMVRLRETLSGNPTSMKIGEVSEVEFADDDYLTVVEEFPLAPRHVRIVNSVAFMDYDVAFGDQHLYPDPVPVLGPYLTPVWLTATEIDVDFDSSDSWALDGGGLTYVWTAPGASTTADLATSTPVISYDTAGTYRVTCVVSRDYGGGNISTATGHRYVQVFTAASPPITQFELDSCSGSWDSGGWTFQVTMYAEATLTTVRDRAAVVLFAKDYYGGTETSIGPVANRATTIAVGWIAGETIAWDPETGTVSFQVRGPQFWLNQMQGFPSGIEDVQVAATDWTEYDTLDLDAGLWHFLHWRTTATKVLDIQLTGDTRGIFLFNASPGTLWQQITVESESILRAHPCCDRYGRLFIEVEPQLVPTGNRSGPTVQLLAAQDLRRPVTLERRVAPPTGQVDLSGITYSAGTGASLFSLSPGHVPKWHGPDTEAATRMALSSQGQSNTLAGLYLDWLNNPYPNITLPLASNHRLIDICPHQYFTLTLAASDTVREITMSAQLLTVRSVAFEYSHETGVLLTDCEAETVTTGAAGINGDIPATPPDPGLPDFTVPPVLDPEPPEETGSGEVWVFGTKGGGVVYTLDMISGNPPTWFQLNAGLGNSAFIRWFAGDPARSSTHLACIDETGEVYVNTAWRAGGRWELALSEAEATTLLQAHLAGPIPSDLNLLQVHAGALTGAEEGELFVLANGTATPGYGSFVRVLRSLDWGTTWAVYGRPGDGAFGRTSPLVGAPTCDYTWREVFVIGDKRSGGGAGGGRIIFNPASGTLVFAARATQGAQSRSNVMFLSHNDTSWTTPRPTIVGDCPMNSVSLGG